MKKVYIYVVSSLLAALALTSAHAAPDASPPALDGRRQDEPIAPRRERVADNPLPFSAVSMEEEKKEKIPAETGSNGVCNNRGKLSREERRVLRKQINEAGHDLYTPSHPPSR